MFKIYKISSFSPVAISAGERLYTRWDYRTLFDKMAADYIQPDIRPAKTKFYF